MKKTFYAALTAVAVIAASCQKQESPATEIFEDTPSATIVLSDGGTKAFFDNTATAETFEKELSSLSILVFDKDDALIVRRNFTDEELSEKTCTFRLPKTVEGTSCKFYAVGNASVDDVQTHEELLAVMDNDAASYNGSFEDVTTKSVRTGGFLMSGWTSETVAEDGETTEVSITLKRTVAKVAVRTKVSDSFSQMYGGKITVLSATIKKGSSAARMISTTTKHDAAADFEYTQTVNTEGEYWNSLFYVYENEYLNSFTATQLCINVIYDMDGNDETTGDQREFSYTIPIATANMFRIPRNAYYRVDATIKGPEGNDCSMAITASEWATPITQTVNLGI